jgi:oligopeptide transport system ATP-binding protein
MALVEATDLTKVFRGRRRGSTPVRAVDGVSFSIDEGKTLALVGESGAGKSTAGRLLLRLIEPDAGKITIDGQDVRSLDRESLRKFRRRATMVFQDPYSSLDPRVPIGDSVAEPLIVHNLVTRREIHQRARAALDRVGIGAHMMHRFPSQLSGGQLQRVAIARALITDPRVIVCDEPVSALDVSIQAQVINLLVDLQDERKLAYLFITHDLSVVEAFADRVLVMRSGVVIEEGTVEDIFDNPADEYTRNLRDAVPVLP